jgi:hypothetical protein
VLSSAVAPVRNAFKSIIIHVRRTDDHLLLLQSSSASRMTAGAATRPVIREKSHLRAQHDSPSLSPAHDGTSLCPNFRALAAFLWGGLFFAQCSRRSFSLM